MELLIVNITIEALFESDNEIPFWQLRQRAEEAGMPMSDFHIAYWDAIKSGEVENNPKYPFMVRKVG